MSEHKFIGIEKPKSVHEWIAVLGFMGVLSVGYLSFAIGETLVDHNKDPRSHPEFNKELELIKQRNESDRQFAELVQHQNERDHQRIMQLLEEIKARQTED